MDLKEEIFTIIRGIEELKKRPLSVERTGLYLLVLCSAVNSCYSAAQAYDEEQRRSRRVDNILQEMNVLGNTTPEKFYYVNGQRVYLEIDGKSVENCFDK